jgi:hypothetical protein
MVNAIILIKITFDNNYCCADLGVFTSIKNPSDWPEGPITGVETEITRCSRNVYMFVVNGLFRIMTVRCDYERRLSVDVFLRRTRKRNRARSFRRSIARPYGTCRRLVRQKYTGIPHNCPIRPASGRERITPTSDARFTHTNVPEHTF